MIYSTIKEENMWDNLNVSPEKIQNLMEFCQLKLSPLLEKQEISIDREADKKKVAKYVKPYSFDRIAKDITVYANKASIVIKRKGLNSNSMKELDIIMSDAFKAISSDLDLADIPELKFKGYDANKIRKSIVLTVYIYFLNSFCDLLISLLLGPVIGGILTAVVIAPIIEESCKRASVVGGYASEFAIVFNTFEFSLYVTRYNEVSKIIAIRLVAVGMHLITFVINWFSNNTKLISRLGMDKDNDKEEITNTGFLLGILIHSIWNAGFSNVVISILGLAD